MIALDPKQMINKKKTKEGGKGDTERKRKGQGVINKKPEEWWIYESKEILIKQTTDQTQDFKIVNLNSNLVRIILNF